MRSNVAHEIDKRKDLKLVPESVPSLFQSSPFSSFCDKKDFSCRILIRWLHHSSVRVSPRRSGVAPEIAGASEDEAEHSQEEVEAPSSNPPPSDRLERQLARRSSFRTFRTSSASKVVSGLPPILIEDSDDEGAPCGHQSPVSLSPGLQDDSIVAGRKQRRLSKAAVPESSRSGRRLKGWKLVLEGYGPLSMDRGVLIYLSQRMRSADCRPPSLVSWIFSFCIYLPNFDKMAPSFFCPLPTIKADRLEELYTVHGVDRAVIVLWV
ncbi:hypothetical protein F2Q68_00033820 [Brassica cretica]|uniref:Uncharacterized protein n=1 Tax=Brassica cretica TaxID=69181 RepID=A0A8S9GZ34_BRACR|nr:hypothetical protein F2Q68_00033820 [Brassica cretica]